MNGRPLDVLDEMKPVGNRTNGRLRKLIYGKSKKTENL